MTDTPSLRPVPQGGATVPVALPRLIATDLDGTLLRDDQTLSSRTLTALDRAALAGVEVVFVTGRPPRWMTVVEEVRSRSVGICSNGAAVARLTIPPRIDTVHALDPDTGLRVAAALRAVDPEVSFAVERTSGIHYDPTYPPFRLDPGASVAPVDKLLAPGPRSASEPVLKLLAHHPTMAPDAFLALARRLVGRDAAVTRSGPTALVEISAPGVTKASTLAAFCAARGIAPHEVVAFGDMPNDLEMLAWAGRSYAMANAHPDLLAVTGRRTADNEADGVALVIEELLAGATAA